MLIIPAIDLKEGHCVRLKQGKFDQVSIYEIGPVALAQQYVQQGAKHLHIVDLDGARAGVLQQAQLIKAMRDQVDQEEFVTFQVGGGIRSLEMAQTCMALRINQLVMGSIAVSDPGLTLEIIKEVGAANIVLAFDVMIQEGIPKPAIHGWQTSRNEGLWDRVSFYQDQGVSKVLCTDIARDGMMQGPNFDLYEEAVQRFPNIAWQASGGIRHVEDIRTLSAGGLTAVILGRMLYESDFDLAACIEEFKC